MLRLINARNAERYRELAQSMHRDRKRLFVDVFGWNLATRNGEERDAFDDDLAEYLVLADGAGRHVASLRFLRTDRPHLLDTVFPELCDAPIPKGPDIREITRLCLPLRKRERMTARNILARGIIDYAAAANIKSYTAVCHAAFYSGLLSAGWRCTPLGALQTRSGERAGAVQIHMESDVKDLLADGWRSPRSDPRLCLTQSGVAA